MGDFEERLIAIKRDGRARRARRARRNTAVLGAAFCVAAVASVAGPWTEDEAGRDDQELAARDSTNPCRNEVDPSCGPLTWDPEPNPNEPATLDVEPVAGASVGQAVTLAATWSDPDAPRASAFVCWGDEPCEVPPAPCVTAGAAGPWTPSMAEPGEGSLRGLSHTFDRPGRYDVTVTLRTVSWPDGSCAPPLGDPYGDVVTASLVVVVR